MKMTSLEGKREVEPQKDMRSSKGEEMHNASSLRSVGGWRRKQSQVLLTCFHGLLQDC